MLNQAAVEALCSGKYLENYLECLENLPDDLQRSVSQLRELDSKTKDFLQDIEHHKENYLKEGDSNQKKRALFQIQRLLIKCQEIGDEKLQLVATILELVESRTRQLELDRENLDPGSGVNTHEKEEEASAKPTVVSKPAKPEEKQEKTGIKRQRRNRVQQETAPKEEEKKVQEEDKDQPKKKKKRKIKKQEKEGDKSPVEPIDPDEPVYCLCQQVSYGEMIGCDNEQCKIEWFHFNCVGLVNKPKGKWYCPNCRGDRPNIPKKN